MKFKPSLIATLIMLLAARVPGFEPKPQYGAQRSLPLPQASRGVTPKATPAPGSPSTYDPPIPDVPFPLDPPDITTDEFDPINDLPLPDDIPFPPEFPLPDPILDLPLPLPDFPDEEDPFPDLEPSLFPGESIGDWEPPLMPVKTNLLRGGTAHATTPLVATNVVTPLMPYPREVFFLPGPPKATPPRQAFNCNPATASNMVMAESGHGSVFFFNVCGSPKGTHVPVGGRYPTAAVASPDETIGYVPVADIGQVVIFDLASKTITGRISLPQFNGFPAQPNTIRILPDSSRAYIGSHVAVPNAPIYVVDLTTNAVIATIPVGAFPSHIELTPDGSQLWVTSRGDSNMTIIDTMTNTIVTQIQNVPLPTGIGFNPTGTVAYVAEGVDAGGKIDVYNTANYQLTAQIPVGDLPHVVRVTASGRFVFVTNAVSNSISVIGAKSNTVLQTIPLAGGKIHPLGLTFIHH